MIVIFFPCAIGEAFNGQIVLFNYLNLNQIFILLF